ncbi:MAG: hypothetical protein INQ03_22695 [Candidatus Heimdallarchaeota archaeon]|nr:hypothetical protein [Candidatus Heimdallarchaeota archaeon]
MFADEMNKLIDTCIDSLETRSMDDGEVSDDEYELLKIVMSKLGDLQAIIKPDSLSTKDLDEVEGILKALNVDSRVQAHEDAKISDDEKALLTDINQYIIEMSKLVRIERQALE